jgi:hypothetical protein
MLAVSNFWRYQQRDVCLESLAGRDFQAVGQLLFQTMHEAGITKSDLSSQYNETN